MVNTAQDVKSRVPCVRFISRYAKFKKSGKGFSAKCPFKDHDDKTPSFFANDSFYKCFGCGRSGDVINFVQEYFSLASFKDALKMIAQLEGISYEPIPQKRDPSALLLERALCMFRENLIKHTHAQKYLVSRGIVDYQKYHLGWSGHGSVPDASLEDLTKVGLVKNGRAFFRNRIMFPIYNNGKICGFGGRSIDGSHPKYLNSPETELFNKSEILYMPRKNVFGIKEIFLVEGYTDAIALDLKGFAAAATMGTAASANHLAKLWKIAGCIYLAFDGDTAGTRATERVINIAIPYISPSRKIKIINLPEGEDPASLSENWEEYKDSATELIDIMWNKIRGSPENQRAVLTDLMRDISRIKDVGVRKFYTRALEGYRVAKWKPAAVVMPGISKLQCMFGLLYKYPDLCVRFENEICSLDCGQYKQLQADALKVAEGLEPSEQWNQCAPWVREFDDAEEVWIELFTAYNKSPEMRKKLEQQYLNDPTDENWQMLIKYT